ncbi:hypothetical protein V502_05730 [Pseudogymnoascus sp. VKM F-4520 (FW-2644)]|nr:hypothetical protein V502_05730 [Pseudogymnoascus sp. VKM F-4520 (FW-2644)]
MSTRNLRIVFVSKPGATPESDDSQESDSEPEQYPTFAELFRRDVVPQLTLDAVRLIWSFRGSLETSLSVMATAYNTDVLEPYFQHTDGGGSWHAISQSPLTEPPVSAIVAKVNDLENWESDWIDFHHHHADPDASYEESGYAKYGDLLGYDPETDENPPHLLKCCYTERPRHKEGGVLVTPSASGKGFVTIHDYVTTMHPWLMRNRQDIVDAMNCYEHMPDAEHMDLVVDLVRVDDLKIEEKSEWVRSLRRWHDGGAGIHEVVISAV